MQAKYPDVVGYVYSANTTLQLPIVQSADEGGEYYLYRDIDGKDNKNGTVFLDIRCNSDFTSQNNLIYGHNMKTGMMFASLMNYKSQSYYEAHPYFYLYTPNQTYKVNLFAGCIVDHDADVYATSLSDSYLQQCINESTFKSGSGVPTGSILTLSTCDYDFDNARYVLMGELIPVKILPTPAARVKKCRYTKKTAFRRSFLLATDKALLRQLQHHRTVVAAGDFRPDIRILYPGHQPF